MKKTKFSLKKGILCSLLVVFTINLQAQRLLEDMYDVMLMGESSSSTYNGHNMGLSYSVSYDDNTDGSLVAASDVMQSLLHMYRSNVSRTGAAKLNYLKLFVRMADNVLARRDDRTGVEDYLGNSEAAWSEQTNSTTPNTHYQFLYSDACLIYPMADFAQMILNTPALWTKMSDSYVTEKWVGGTLVPYQATHTQLANKTFKDIAEILIVNIRETIQLHQPEWLSTSISNGMNQIGVYLFEDTPAWAAIKVISDNLSTNMRGHGTPLNYNAQMGKALLFMYKALVKKIQIDGPNTVLEQERNLYLDMTKRLGNMIKLNMEFTTLPGNNCYYWRYFSEFNGFPSVGDPGYKIDDISHGELTAHFAALLFDNNINSPDNSAITIFNQVDMAKLGGTVKRMYNGPVAQRFHYRLDGTTPSGKESDAIGFSTHLGEFMRFAPYNTDVYNLLMELYSEQVDPDFGSTALSAPKCKGVACAVRFRELLAPVALGRFSSSVQWAGFDAGDFDGDGKAEILAARNSDGDVILEGLSTSFPYPNYQAKALLDYGDASEWVDVAVGDIDNDGRLEGVGYRTFDQRVYVWEWNGTTLVPDFSDYIVDRNYIGIELGDVDGDGKAELIMLSNNDGDTYFYEMNGTGASKHFSMENYKIQNGSGSDWSGLAVGNFDGDTKMDLLQVRNFDGNMYLYELDGSSTGFTLLGSRYYNNSNLDWKEAACADFDADGRDELVVANGSDGDLYFYDLSGATLVSTNRAFYTNNLENTLVAAADISGDCVAEVVNARNNDGWLYTYEYMEPIICEVSGGDDKRKRRFQQEEIIVEAASTIQVYPNPFENQLTFELDKSWSEKVDISIFSLQGQRLFSRTTNTSNSIQIELPNLANGVYLYEIKGNRQTERGKIIKMD